MKTERQLRKEMVEICRRMYDKGLISSTDGNVSVKLPDGRLMITPSGVNKGYLKEDQMAVVDQQGKWLAGPHKPSGELSMHLCAYQYRSDIFAAVHAHPPLCVAFSLAKIPIAKCILPEVIISLGEIPVTRYATPTTELMCDIIKDLVVNYNAIILDRHGTLTIGHDLEAAFNRLETMEHAAKITLAAKQLGPVSPLPQEEVNNLIAMGRTLGLQRVHEKCQECGVCEITKTISSNISGIAPLSSSTHASASRFSKQELVKIIVEEIDKLMRSG